MIAIKLSSNVVQVYKDIWQTRLLNAIPTIPTPQKDILIQFYKNCEMDRFDGVSPLTAMRGLRLMAQSGIIHMEKRKSSYGGKDRNWFWKDA